MRGAVVMQSGQRSGGLWASEIPLWSKCATIVSAVRTSGTRVPRVGRGGRPR